VYLRFITADLREAVDESKDGDCFTRRLANERKEAKRKTHEYGQAKSKFV
jgi:hypothetical protein